MITLCCSRQPLLSILVLISNWCRRLSARARAVTTRALLSNDERPGSLNKLFREKPEIMSTAAVHEFREEASTLILAVEFPFLSRVSPVAAALCSERPFLFQQNQATLSMALSCSLSFN